MILLPIITYSLTSFRRAEDTRSGYHTGLGFDWDINKYNGISGSVSYANFGHKSNGVTNQLQQTKDQAGNLLSDIENSINSDHTFHFHNVDASLNYKKTFKKDEQELDLAVNTSNGNRNVRDNIYQYHSSAGFTFLQHQRLQSRY